MLLLSNCMKIIAQKLIAVIRRRSVKSGDLRNFAKFTGKHLCKRLFFNKVAGPVAAPEKLLNCKVFKTTIFSIKIRLPTITETSIKGDVL